MARLMGKLAVSVLPSLPGGIEAEERKARRDRAEVR